MGMRMQIPLLLLGFLAAVRAQDDDPIWGSAEERIEDHFRSLPRGERTIAEFREEFPEQIKDEIKEGRAMDDAAINAIIQESFWSEDQEVDTPDCGSCCPIEFDEDKELEMECEDLRMNGELDSLDYSINDWDKMNWDSPEDSEPPSPAPVQNICDGTCDSIPAEDIAEKDERAKTMGLIVVIRHQPIVVRPMVQNCCSPCGGCGKPLVKAQEPTEPVPIFMEEPKKGQDSFSDCWALCIIITFAGFFTALIACVAYKTAPAVDEEDESDETEYEYEGEITDDEIEVELPVHYTFGENEGSA